MTAKKKQPARRFEMQFDTEDTTYERLQELSKKSRRPRAEVVRQLIRKANVSDVV